MKILSIILTLFPCTLGKGRHSVMLVRKHLFQAPGMTSGPSVLKEEVLWGPKVRAQMRVLLDLVLKCQ